MVKHVYIFLVNGVNPFFSLKKQDITDLNILDITFGWDSIETGYVKNIAPNGGKNLIFRIPINTRILTSNISNSRYKLLSDYEVKGVEDIERDIEYEDIEYEDVEIKDGVYATTIKVSI